MTHARTASATRHSTAPHRHQCPRTPQDHQAGRDIGALGHAGTGEFWPVARVAAGVGAPLAERSEQRPAGRVPVPHHL